MEVTRILILAANPQNTARLRLEEEVREIDAGLRRAKGRERFLLDQRWALRPRDLRQALLDVEPQVVHFCGHGGVGGLVLEDSSGQPSIVEPEAMAGLFDLFAGRIKCVILNACYSENQARAIARHIDYVVGISQKIGDRAAIEFSVGFYDALGSGRSIEEAYKFGCNAILLAGVPAQQVPVLIQRMEAPESRRDWGEAPDVSVLFGRAEELAELERWIVEDHCRVVAILGLRGIGKTALSIRLGRGEINGTDLSAGLVQGIQDRFECVFWRSLLSLPPVSGILAELIRFLSDQQEIDLPDTVSSQISRLLCYLRAHRSLVILDNFETVLQGGKQAGHYLEGYEGFGTLLEEVGQARHQSCVLLTSREKPKEIARLEGISTPVRSLVLGGLEEIEARKIFGQVGFFSGSDDKWRQLTAFYDGNPLALELAARHIKEVFAGDISEFLKRGQPVFGNLRELLDWHFDRLPGSEREIVYWLAIAREPVSMSELQGDILSPVAKEEAPSTLESLLQRWPLVKTGIRFSLQPVLMEYITNRLVVQIVEEIESGEFRLLNSHALLKALAGDYVRESQVRLILQPIIHRLSSILGNTDKFEIRLQQILSTLRCGTPLQPGYMAGNILNLLCQMNVSLSHYDFSRLSVWQAYLQETDLAGVDFSYADLSHSVFSGNFGGVVSLAFTQNDQLIAAGTTDGEVRLWHGVDGKHLLTCRDHSDRVRTVAFSPDGKLLASGSDDRTIRLLDITTGQTLRILQCDSAQITSVAFDPNGRILASGGSDHIVRLWNIETGECLETLSGHSDQVRSVDFSADGRMLVSSGADQTIRLWNIAGQCIRILRDHVASIGSVVFSPSGKLIASGGEDHTVRIWSSVTGQCSKTISGHTDQVRCVVFCPDERTVISCSDDDTIRVWEVSSGRCLRTLLGHRSWVRAIACGNDGKTLLSGSEDRTVRIWNIRSGECLRTLQGYSNRIGSISISTGGDIIASGGGDQKVRLWLLSTGKCFSRLLGHGAQVWSVAFSPDGQTLASGSDDSTIRLWNTCGNQCLKTLHGHDGWVSSVSFSPDGKMLASGSGDKNVRIWDVYSGLCLRTLQGHDNRVWAVVFNPDGRMLASAGGDRIVRLWDAHTGKILGTLPGYTNPAWPLAFSPDGSRLAIGSDDQVIKLWDVNGGYCAGILEGHTSWIGSIAFHPSGSILASGGGDHSVRLWDIATERCLRILQGHAGRVWSVAFSENGDTLISGSEDGSIRIWEPQMGTCQRILRDRLLYEDMNITGVTGLTAAQKATLRALGAVEMNEYQGS